MRIKKPQLGKLLLDMQLITPQQLEKAFEQQNQTGQRLGEVLVELNFIEEEQLLDLISKQLGIPYINLKEFPLKPDVVNLLPELYARNFRALVLDASDDTYLVAMVDPQDIVACDEVARILQKNIRLALVKEKDFLEAVDLLYRKTAEISSFAEELSEEMGKNKFTISQLGAGLSVSDAPVAKLLESIFEDAVNMNASDIHIEPEEKLLRIRQRIDGMLHEQIIYEKEIASALTSRLKLMAGINITEKRIPQDGRFTVKVRDKNFDVRLATLPVQYGESVVMRILGQTGEILPLNKLGIPTEILTHLRKIIHFPYGLLLITGPTGSGKSTTLYGALTELNVPEKKILTVEDPVEYRIERINQVQVNNQIDFTFARALRAFLRNDPDIIMVGELRDQETVAIALRAAMTGHFVLSTLHTNDAISSAIRLLDMGAEGYLIASVVRCIVAQRLIRRICSNCAADYELSPNEEVWLKGINGGTYVNKKYKKGTGCSYCNQTGYKGRIGVFELIEFTPHLSDLMRRGDTDGFTQAAKQQPTYKPLVVAALDFAIEGITTISEIIRIIGESLIDTEDNESQEDSLTTPSAEE